MATVFSIITVIVFVFVVISAISANNKAKQKELVDAIKKRKS